MIRDKFTLIITVHERKGMINSLLVYYSDLPCNIIVADSSIGVVNINLTFIQKTPSKELGFVSMNTGKLQIIR
jgi:ACT domain-containing protein